MHSFDTLNFGAFWQEKQEREGKQNWEERNLKLELELQVNMSACHPHGNDSWKGYSSLFKKIMSKKQTGFFTSGNPTQQYKKYTKL